MIHNDGSEWVNCCHVTVAWAAIGQVNDNGWGLDLAFPIVALSFSFSC